MSDTPETDQIEKYDGFKIKDTVTTCGDESSSVYINVIHARQLERERNKARKKYDNLATEHMLVVNKLCQERDDARDALMNIEEIFVDGEDAYNDWMKAANIAKYTLEKIND